ncbi:glycosyltransferase family 2 protein [Flavobacteriaceae bacterium]|nr:glycosyltransferase family 2 protein [Flavobacteriaceae bacterium]
MSPKPSISAVVITLNEGEIITSFLQQLDFVDEVILVDSHSTDQTVSLAKRFDNVRVFSRDFDDFSSQKNFALDQVSQPWVLLFDPDEVITAEAKKEILDAVARPRAEAYFIRRQLYFMGKKIRFSGFQTDWVIRLGRTELCRYNGRLVHETISVDGTTARLKSRIPHHTYKSFSDYLAKLDRYSTLQAQMAFEAKKKVHLGHFIWRPFYRFWHQYLIRLGILDGLEGWILASINAQSVFKRYVKLFLMYRQMP